MSTFPVTIYTDGACSGNPGPGGWAALLRMGDKERELSGAEAHTTNQRMEIRGALEGLRSLHRPRRVGVYSDSAYVVNCFRDKWYERWLRNGWKSSQKKPVENRDLWEALTSAERIPRWFAPVSGDLRLGGRFQVYSGLPSTPVVRKMSLNPSRSRS